MGALPRYNRTKLPPGSHAGVGHPVHQYTCAAVGRVAITVAGPRQIVVKCAARAAGRREVSFTVSVWRMKATKHRGGKLSEP